MSKSRETHKIVCRSIETNGLSKSRVLPQSGNYDSVMCSHAMDVDWDGECEIMIGTYGRQVLIYKQGKEGEWKWI